MKLRGADILARTLVANGVREVFALSGNHVMPVFDAALDAGLSILHVRHEAAAVHMADAWGRLTGKPGVALVTGGPGHANALGALYTALAAESPMLLISGHASRDELGMGAFQEMPQVELAAPLTKASFMARSSADFAKALREARRGPVHLSVPQDLLEAVVDGELAVVEHPIQEPTPIPDAFKEAKRPLIIAGPGAVHGDGKDQLRHIEEESGIPVIIVESPRGLNDPALGKVSQVLSHADAVLLLRKPLDFTLKFGKAFAPDCRIFRAQALLPWKGKANGWLKEVHELIAYRPAEYRSIAQCPHPIVVCRAVQNLLDEGSVLVCDGGEFGQWAQALVSVRRRIINGVAGSIGSALPFAAAAKRAFPNARVVAMLGDGAFGFHMSELDTAVRYGLDYLAVVGNDATWNAEYQIQLRSYGAARAHGCELLPTQYGAVATAMGAHGEDVLMWSDLSGAMSRAAGSGKPACVNVMIERVAAPKY